MTRNLRRIAGGAAMLLALVASHTTASGQDGRDVYDETCVRCHGLLREQSAWRGVVPTDGSQVRLAVVTPQGPTLNGIVGRPAGIVEGYQYSKGMRAFAGTGAVWNRETLDEFLTDSRKFVTGTFMILKMEAEDRRLVLDYLERVARYQP